MRFALSVVFPLILIHSSLAFSAGPFDFFKNIIPFRRQAAPPAPQVLLGQVPQGTGCEISLQIMGGHEFTQGELFSALVGIGNRNRLGMYHPHILKELRKLAEVETNDELMTPQGQFKAFRRFRWDLGEEKYRQLVGEMAQGLATQVRPPFHSTNYGVPVTDIKDMHRIFGFRLLAEDDRAFSDPLYLAKTLAYSNVAVATKYDGMGAELKKQFDATWKSLSPNTEVVNFSLTGSDAINSLYDALKNALLAKRKQRSTIAPIPSGVEILSFNGQWGASKGPGSELHNPKAWPGADEKNSLLPLPVTDSLNPSPSEIERLKPIEESAIRAIRERFNSANPQRPVGGLLIEPILGAGGVFFYRPEFLMRVRAICDELDIPIVADEILTGGGRTGKFFGYEHYAGFEPDLVTFGKGLYVAGVARVNRQGKSLFSDARGQAPEGSFPFDSGLYGTTIIQYSEPLLKSTQIMTRIREDNLMQNAAEVGAYFLQRLQANSPDAALNFRPRGIGLLLNDNSDFSNLVGIKNSNQMGRMMPYLSLSKSEVDAFFVEREKAKERRDSQRLRMSNTD